MTARANINFNWEDILQPVSPVIVGDVRDVLHSRVQQTRPLPAITHGLGALTHLSPTYTGEGLCIGNHPYLTPAIDTAGEYVISQQEWLTPFATPFFVGWSGRPSATGSLHSNEVLKLSDFYQQLSYQCQREHVGTENMLLLLEAVALCPVRAIDDRVLCNPVTHDKVLITGEAVASHYFRFRVIEQNLMHRFSTPPRLLPLVMVGVCVLEREPLSDKQRQLLAKAFYTPPFVSPSTKVFLTHTHALAWQPHPATVNILQRELEQPAAATHAQFLSYLLQSRPDYLVHVDETTQLSGATFNLYLTTLDSVAQISV